MKAEVSGDNVFRQTFQKQTESPGWSPGLSPATLNDLSNTVSEAQSPVRHHKLRVENIKASSRRLSNRLNFDLHRVEAESSDFPRTIFSNRPSLLASEHS